MNKDARFASTEVKIRKAFFELLEELGFDKLNIKLLVERASINRTTFYLHYDDKFDMLNRIENELFDEIPKIIGISNPSTFKFPPNPSSIRLVAAYVEKNKEIFALITRDSVDPFFVDKQVSRLISAFGKMATSNLSDVSSEYMLNVVASAISGFYKTWISRGFKESADEFANQVLTSVHNIADIVNKVDWQA